MNSGFRRGWLTCERKLTKRERRVSLAQLGNFLQSRRQLLQIPGATETLDCTKLLVRRTARANEVRMVGVGESIRARSRRGQDGALLEDEHGAAGAGECEHTLDRVDAFRVGDRVAAAVDDPQLDSLLRREARDEVRTLQFGAAQLEVRGPRAAERGAAEQRA